MTTFACPSLIGQYEFFLRQILKFEKQTFEITFIQLIASLAVINFVSTLSVLTMIIECEIFSAHLKMINSNPHFVPIIKAVRHD